MKPVFGVKTRSCPQHIYSVLEGIQVSPKIWIYFPIDLYSDYYFVTNRIIIIIIIIIPYSEFNRLFLPARRYATGPRYLLWRRVHLSVHTTDTALHAHKPCSTTPIKYTASFNVQLQNKKLNNRKKIAPALPPFKVTQDHPSWYQANIHRNFILVVSCYISHILHLYWAIAKNLLGNTFSSQPTYVFLHPKQNQLIYVMWLVLIFVVNSERVNSLF